MAGVERRIRVNQELIFHERNRHETPPPRRRWLTGLCPGGRKLLHESSRAKAVKPPRQARWCELRKDGDLAR
jgi:hypothetical protein